MVVSDRRGRVRSALMCAALLPLAGCGPSRELADLASLTGESDKHGAMETGSIAKPRGHFVLEELSRMLAAGQKREALQTLRKHVAEQRIEKVHAFDYARLALQLGDPVMAGDLLSLADDGQDTDGRVLTAKGAALAEQGLFKESLTYFEKAHRRSPGDPAAMSNLGIALVAAGDARKAEDLLRQAHRLRPSDDKIRENLAIALAAQGRDLEARALAADLFATSSG